MDHPILLHQQIFKNKEGSEGILYLISSGVKFDKKSIERIYQKRWKVEVFHIKIEDLILARKFTCKKDTE